MSLVEVTVAMTGHAPIARYYEGNSVEEWQHFEGSVGGHLCEVPDCPGVYGFRLTDGVYNGEWAGSVRVDYVRVRVMQGARLVCHPQAPHLRINETTVDIFTSRDMLIVQCSYGFDFGIDVPLEKIYDRPRLKRGHQLSDVQIPLPANPPLELRNGNKMLVALQRGISDASTWNIGLMEPREGSWHYRWWAQCYEPGGWGIQAFGNATNDPVETILAERLVMRRSFIDCLDRETGRPIANPEKFPEGFNLNSGLYVFTTFPRFHERVSATSNKTRPRYFNNDGQCPYDYKMHGYDYDNGVNIPDARHTVRDEEPIFTACYFYDDPISKIDQRMLQQRVAWAMVTPNLAGIAIGQGSGYYGTRGHAWTTRALQRGPNPDYQAIGKSNALASVLAQIRGAGMTFRAQSDYGDHGDNWGFVPNCWKGSFPGDRVIPLNVDACPTMEQWFTDLTWGEIGEWDDIEESAAAIFIGRRGIFPKKSVAQRNEMDPGNCPKFVGVGALHGETFRAIDEYMGPRDYFGYIPLALMAHHAMAHGKNPDKWLLPALEMSPPSLPKPSYTPADTTDTKKKKMLQQLYADPVGIAHTAALISAFEASLVSKKLV